MNNNKNIVKKTLYLDHRVLDDNRKDFLIPILLTRTYGINEYVDVKKDNYQYIIERQDINPYYIEFGFFDTIKSISSTTIINENILLKANEKNIIINK